MAALPVIDFSPFISSNATPSQRAHVAADLDSACRTLGFFYLRGHGVPQDLIDGVRQHAIDFFRTTSDEDKQQLAIKSDDKARGYSKHADADKGSHEVFQLGIALTRCMLSYLSAQGPRLLPTRRASRQRTLHNRPRRQPMATSPQRLPFGC